MKNKKVVVWGVVVAFIALYAYLINVVKQESFSIDDGESKGEIVFFTKGASSFKVINKIKFIYYDSYIDIEDGYVEEDIPGYSMKEVGDDVEVTCIPSKMTIDSWSEVLGYDLSEYLGDVEMTGQDIKYSDAVMFLRAVDLIE